MYFKTKVDFLYRNVRKKFLNLTPTPKIALKDRKGQKRPQLWAVLPKPKFVVYISRPKV